MTLARMAWRQCFLWEECQSVASCVLHLYGKVLYSYTEAVTVKFTVEKLGDVLCLWFLAVQLLGLILCPFERLWGY